MQQELCFTMAYCTKQIVAFIALAVAVVILAIVVALRLYTVTKAIQMVTSGYARIIIWVLLNVYSTTRS